MPLEHDSIAAKAMRNSQLRENTDLFGRLREVVDICTSAKYDCLDFNAGPPWSIRGSGGIDKGRMGAYWVITSASCMA